MSHRNHHKRTRRVESGKTYRRVVVNAIRLAFWCIIAMTLVLTVTLTCLIVPTLKTALLLWWLTSAA